MTACIFIFCLLGAASAQISTARKTEKIAKANNDFSQRLYQQIAVCENNQIYSGYSIHVAMSLLSLGARGDTRTEIETSLGLNVFRSQTARNQAYSDVIEQLNSAPKVKVLTANGVFVNQERTVRGAFVNDVRKYYQADVSTFDPRDPACPETVINDYVENKTQGLIRDLIPPNVINALTEVVVVNTICFNASWQEPFSDRETRLADFFSAQGTIQVPTMFSTRSMKIKRNFYGADVGELALGDGRFSFVMLLPYNLNGLEEQGRCDQPQFVVFGNVIVSSLPLLSERDDNVKVPQTERSLTNPGRIKALFEGLNPVRVNMSLPKFNINSSYELTTPLKALGIIKAFDHEQANLTGINSGGGISISNVFHQAMIEVNEAGISAAAATAVEISAVSLPPPQTETIKFNRPFIYIITNNETILFQGKHTG